MSRSRVLRSSISRAFYSVFGGILICSPVLAVLAAGTTPVGLVVGFAAMVLIGAFLLRLAMVKVVVHDDHVELVNPLRRFRFSWHDVEEIDIISGAGWIVRVWAGGGRR
ncbi:PH domain-containing protein [Actinoplanes sp. NPDC049548]|uniref:PH domain-containing protein n=1 Tax=Actinoplanes sp. NPDC049548 TaxID=3155152 RepID=UPI0034386565